MILFHFIKTIKLNLLDHGQIMINYFKMKVYQPNKSGKKTTDGSELIKVVTLIKN